MNNRVSAFVRLFPLLLAVGFALPALAQGDRKSLTRDFDKLSAKERSRIASQETAEADRDTSYQRLMREGDELFRAGRYEDALAVFSRARELRPYNVYPKVKMEDLQALIRKRDQDAAATPEAPPPDPVPAPAPPAEGLPPAQTAEPAPVQAVEPLPPSKEVVVPARTVKAPSPTPSAQTPTAPVAAPPVARPSVPATAPRPAPDPGERVYVEGQAVVTERTVEEEGKLVLYKRVAHNWGQTFYFKDGLSITDRQWEERFIGLDP